MLLFVVHVAVRPIWMNAGLPTAAKYDFVETMLTLKRRLEICADDVGEEPEDLKDVCLTSAIGADEHVEIAQRQRDLPQASKVLHRKTEQSTVHVRDLSRKGSRKPRSSRHVPSPASLGGDPARRGVPGPGV